MKSMMSCQTITATTSSALINKTQSRKSRRGYGNYLLWNKNYVNHSLRHFRHAKSSIKPSNTVIN